MEQRHTRQRRRARARQRRTGHDATTTLVLLATALAAAAQHASAAVMGNDKHGGVAINHLQSRQYPSDSPACAQTCIRVKIEEAADPGLAVGCDYRTSGYVACLCASNKFTAAYEQCLLDNCIFPSSLATGRSLFQTFCAASTSGSEVSRAVAVASSAVASQASEYSRTASLNSTAASSSSMDSSSTSGASSMITSTTTSGASSAASGTTGTSGSSGATTASTATRSRSSLTPEQISSARANATGVSAAHHLRNPVSSWTLAATSAFVLLGSLAVLA
ncbi:hypothetical protein P389DRAFT_93485 [Cystobasidium minutum MCA 4210]|uniref:uncharacterized protein n=1 Tax=Cystobasidium minutum MCA 4210 TaxID=1397322 RepID=UPI0034CE43CC|eukprot:jgi/Rhomi1/93485/CE93484_292